MGFLLSFLFFFFFLIFVLPYFSQIVTKSTQFYWNAGCQLVSLCYHIPGVGLQVSLFSFLVAFFLSLFLSFFLFLIFLILDTHIYPPPQLNKGMFAFQGRCGYLLKPNVMFTRDFDCMDTNFNSGLAYSLKLDIISGQVCRWQQKRGKKINTIKQRRQQQQQQEQQQQEQQQHPHSKQIDISYIIPPHHLYTTTVSGPQTAGCSDRCAAVRPAV